MGGIPTTNTHKGLVEMISKTNPLVTVEVPHQYPVQIFRTLRDEYAVRYGLQLKSGLSREEAAKEFGQCIFHALACNGLLDGDE